MTNDDLTDKEDSCSEFDVIYDKNGYPFMLPYPRIAETENFSQEAQYGR